MHTVLHILSQLLFVCIIALVFTVAMVYRPGAVTPPSRRSVLIWMVLGLVLGGVFLTTYALYVPNNPV